MIFADFIAPYSPTMSFPEQTFHPGNLEMTSKGLKIREYRVLSSMNWNYAKVKGSFHNVGFFTKGEKHKILGIFPTEYHLFGAKDSDYPVFIFGSDNLGRDLFSRIVYGSRISLTIGFVATFASLIIATILGGLAGFFGGITDWSVMRFSEFLMLVPGLYLILFLRSLLNTNLDSGTTYMIITLILSMVAWPGTARMLRGMVHSIKREDFVQDAVLGGMPPLTIIFRHIIPQMSSLLIVSTALSVPGFIMSETVLSYLGLGIADPSVSWGSLINRNISTLSNLKNFPWLLIPVWNLILVTLAYNFFGDVLRDFFDPYHAVFKKHRILKKKSERDRMGAEGRPSGPEAQDSPTAKTFESIESNVFADSPKENSKKYLSVENLCVTFSVLRGTTFKSVRAVKGVSFSMEKGEILGIVGESGSGKSVTTLCIPALHGSNAAISGKIFFDGTELTALSSKEMRNFRGKRIGCIYQEPGRAFDPLQNMSSVFFETFKNSWPEITIEESDKKACELLTETGLFDSESRLKNFPHQFSGGQLQRISIALALAQGCDLLIADEPTTALDVTIQAQIVELLLQLKRSRGLSIIFISHNIDLVSKISDKIIIMYGGLIMERGNSAEIMENPRHPYTRALLASSPKFGMSYKNEKLTAIPGRVTDPSEKITGCPFAPRCSECIEVCSQENWSGICPKM